MTGTLHLKALEAYLLVHTTRARGENFSPEAYGYARYCEDCLARLPMVELAETGI